MSFFGIPGSDDSFRLRLEADRLLRATFTHASSDQAAEVDGDNVEFHSEQVSSDGTVEQFLEKAGKNLNDDPIAALKSIKIGSIVRALAEEAGIPYSMISKRDSIFEGWKPGEENHGISAVQFNAWWQARKEYADNVLANFAGRINRPVLAQALGKYRVNRSVSSLLGSFHSSGIAFEGHGQGVMAIAKMGLEGGDLAIAGYTVNHPELLAELERHVSLKGVTLTTQLPQKGFFEGADLVAQTVFKHLRGRGLIHNEYAGRTGFEDAMDKMTANPSAIGTYLYKHFMYEHYKLIGANLRNKNVTIDKKAFLLGSTNFTEGALGTTRVQLGGAVRNNGFNIENSVLVHYNLVDSGTIKRDLFQSLIGQASVALERIEGRIPDRDLLTFTQAGPNGVSNSTGLGPMRGRDMHRTRLLTNKGYVEAYKQLMSELALKGGEATLGVPYAPGDERGGFLELLEAAVSSNQNVKINIITGGGHGGADPLPGMEAFWKRMVARGLDSRINLVQSHIRMAHTKSLYVDFGAGEEYALVGSTNPMKGMWGTTYMDDEGREHEVKNLGMLIYGKEWAGLDDAHGRFKGQVNAIGSLTPYGIHQSGLISRTLHDPGNDPYYRHKALTELTKSVSDELGMSEIAKKYGFKGEAMQVITTGNIKTQEVQAHIVASVGGTFQVRTGRKTESFNLGNITEFTAVKNSRSDKGQWFIPELSKSIGEVLAVGKAAENQALSKVDDARIASPLETMAGGVYAANRYIQATLETMVKQHGVEYTRQKLADPVFRKALRRNIREYSKSIFEHFAGLEQGESSFGAKSLARLLMPVDERGRLLMQPGENYGIGARQLDESLSKVYGERGLRIQLQGAPQILPMAGSLSKYSKGHHSPARLYGFDVFSHLNISGVFYRKNGQDLDEGKAEALVLMPSSKIEQIAQRVQTHLASRSLAALNVAGTAYSNSISGHSRIVTQQELHQNPALANAYNDQSRTQGRGVKFFGILALGLTGDNAYFIDSQFKDQYFGDEFYQLSASIDMADLDTSTFKDITRRQLSALFAQGKHFGEFIEGGNKAVLTAEGRAALDDQLRVSEHNLGGGRKYERVAPIKIADKSKGVIIDLANEKNVQRKDGTILKQLAITTAETLYSGVRLKLGAKAPAVMAAEQSPLVQNALIGVDKGGAVTRSFLGTDNFNVILGSGVLKTGVVAIETGAHVLQKGIWKEQMDTLLGSSMDAGKVTKGLLGDLTQAIERFMPYMDLNLKGHLQSLLDNSSISDLERILSDTQAHLNRGGSISLTSGQLHHVAASVIAFGIHAEYYMTRDANRQAGHHAVYGNPEDSPVTNKTMGLVPIYMVSAISSTDMPMSSRDRINLLSYHSSGLVDSVFDLMSLERSVKLRESGFQELVMGGLMGSDNTSEITVAGLGINPIAEHFQPGYENELAGILRATRELQGYGRRGKASPTRVAELKGIINRGIAEIEAKVNNRTASGKYAFTSDGSQLSFNVNNYLSVLEKSGVGSRTMYLPVIGREIDNDMVHDLEKGRVLNHLKVRLMSAGALKSIGSFSDFSHEIQTLQYEVERLAPVLNRVMYNGRIRANISEQDKHAYQNLMVAAEQLKDIQEEAVATALQKTLGGQLAVKGTNMIAGTLPGIQAGYMVLGDDKWTKVKRQLAAELMTAVRRGAGQVIEQAEEDAYGLTRTKKSKVGLLGSMRLLLDGMSREHNANVTDLLNKVSSFEVAEMAAGLFSGGVGTKAKMDLVTEVVNNLLDNEHTRSALARTVFQRAGAPMGPAGLVFTRILTVSEYNKTMGGGQNDVYLSEMNGMQRRSMFIFSGAMAQNLGDFDGDTAAIAAIAGFTRLSALQLINPNRLDKDETTKLAKARKALNYSSEEMVIRHARFYTGMDAFFSDELLYGSRDSNAAERMHGLLAQAAKGVTLSTSELEDVRTFELRKKDMYQRAIAFNKFSKDIHETDYALRSEIFREASVIRAGNPSLTKEEAWRMAKANVSASSTTFKMAVDTMSKHMNSLLKPQDALTWQEAVVYFEMTSLAATEFMGKQFEIEHALVGWAQLERGSAAAKIARRVRELTSRMVGDKSVSDFDKYSPHEIIDMLETGVGRPTGLSADQVKMLVGEYAEATNLMDKRTGLALLYQQMARDAIKPKLAGSLRDKVRNEISKNPGTVPSAREIVDTFDNVKAMKDIYALATGHDFDSGKQLNSRTWDAERKDQAVRNVKAALGLYHGDIIESAVASGVTYKDYLNSLYGTATDFLVGNADDIERAAKDVAEKRESLVAGKELIDAELALKQAHASAMTAYFNSQIEKQAIETVNTHVDASGYARAKRAYNQSLAEGNFSTFYGSLNDSYLLPEDQTKLKMSIIASDALREKLDTPEKMKLAMQDLFQDIQENGYEIDKIRELAESSGNLRFARQIVAMYGKMSKGVEFEEAVKRLEEEEFNRVSQAADKTSKAKERIKSQGYEALRGWRISENNQTSVKRVRESSSESNVIGFIEGVSPRIGRAMGYEPEQTDRKVRSNTVNSTSDAVLLALDSPKVTTFASQIAAPALAMAMMGGSLAGALAPAGAMAVISANPRLMFQKAFSDSGQAALHTATLAAAFGAGMAGSKIGAMMGARFGGHRLGGFGAHLGAGLGGFIAGAAANVLLEKATEELGWNHIRKVSTVLGDQALRKSELVSNDENMGIDEDEGFGEEDSWDGHLDISLNDGEPIKAVRELYPIASATREGGDYAESDAPDISTDPDTHIAWVSYAPFDSYDGIFS